MNEPSEAIHEAIDDGELPDYETGEDEEEDDYSDAIGSFRRPA